MAFTMPWKRFEEIVHSIESRLLTIRDVARCVGLVEGRTTMMISQQTLALLQLNIKKPRNQGVGRSYTASIGRTFLEFLGR